MNILSFLTRSKARQGSGSFFSLLTLVVSLCASACGPSGPSTTPPTEPESDCEAQGTPQLELGTSVDDGFEVYVEGAEFILEFASQSGMAGDLSLRAKGLALSEVREVRCRLLVDGEAVGEAVTQGSSLDCREGYAELETSLPIDVGGHPTINSVVQLEERVGELVVSLSSEHGIIAEERINVLIRL